MSLAFLQDLRAPLEVQQPEQEFQVAKITTDELGQTHVRLQQTWLGLPVYGGEVLVHLNRTGQPVLFTGRYFRSPVGVATAAPTVSASAAAALAETDLRGKTTFATLSPAMRDLLQYTGPVTELVVFHPTLTAAPVLAWHVTTRPSMISRWESFVDARTGAVLQQYESSCSVNGPRTASAVDLNGVTRTFNTYEWNNQFYMLDGVQTMFNLARSTMPGVPVGALMTFDSGNAILSATTVNQCTTPQKLDSLAGLVK